MMGLTSVARRTWHALPGSIRSRILELRARRKQFRNSRAFWTRRVMDVSVFSSLADLDHPRLDIVEISGTAHTAYPWRSHVNRSFPEHDVCQPFLGEPICDVITCEQVLEHVPDPIQAAKSMLSMLRPGGFALVNVPFLLRVHPHPEDYWRFTPSGLRMLLDSAGFEVVSVDSWGNHGVVRANLRRWAPDRPWRSMKNDPLTPVVVWAVARRPIVDPSAGD